MYGGGTAENGGVVMIGDVSRSVIAGRRIGSGVRCEPGNSGCDPNPNLSMLCRGRANIVKSPGPDRASYLGRRAGYCWDAAKHYVQ